jgi:predicted small metal-binding protein
MNPILKKPTPKGVTMARDKGKKPSQGNLHLRCADVGDPDCTWEARGHDDAEIMKQMEQHAREAHNQFSLDNSARNRIRSVIHNKKAA